MRIRIGTLLFSACLAWGASNRPVVLKRTPPKTAEPDMRIELTAPPMPEPAVAEAIRVSEQWKEDKTAPVLGPDGSVQYQYGHGFPVVICAAYKVCLVELEQGEKITGVPQLGDSVRWAMEKASYGEGEAATPLIVLKPQDAGKDTDLFVPTNRRAYYLRLISRETSFTPRVRFTYPEDEAKKWAIQEAALDAEKRQPIVVEKVQPVIAPVEQMHFGYTIKGGGKDWMRPTRVFDDSEKTYMQMPAELKNRTAPALIMYGDDGKPTMGNYRVAEHGTWIIDGIYDKFELKLGTGRKAKTVKITRETKERG